MTEQSLPRRTRARRLWLPVLALTLAAGLTPSGASHASPDSGAPTPTAAQPAVHRVTLLTGDTVTVTELPDGRLVTTMEPQDLVAGGIRTVTINGDHYVFPPAAMPFVADGSIDRELFNVSALVEQDLTDADRTTLPLIVQYEDAAASKQDPAPDGAVRTRTLGSIDSAAVATSKDDATAFWQDVTGRSPSLPPAANPRLRDGIVRVWLDGRVEAKLAESVAQIGAPAAWAAGFEGDGVTVAVLDSGIDADHPDLAGQVDDAVSFVPGETVVDVHGHGTHVASTVVGTGEASGGTERGVAPGADLLVGKVLDDTGFGQDSWIIDAMEWAASRADVVNMSLGSLGPSDGTDPMSQALNTLSEDTGALFVVAAGNAGAPQTVSSPGAADAALTVGAVDSADQLAWFSSQGPRLSDEALKPDLVAPGQDILAARSQDSSGEGYYTTMSGTSMATPHVVGAAALLAQRHPGWDGARLKDALMSTTKVLDGMSPYQVGTGRLDVAATVLGDVHATGSVFLGFDRWPHGDEPTVTRTITYTNDGDADVHLDLDTAITDSAGSPPPAGMFTFSAASVDVAAHGSADVTVTVDQLKGVAGQRYLGSISARAGDATVAHTTVGFVKEDERYDLTLNATDRTGAPALAYAEIIGNGGYEVVPVDGTITKRLPAGTYSVMAALEVDVDTDHAGYAQLGSPEVRLTGDRVVELDARDAVPVTATVPRDNVEATHLRMNWYRKLGGLAIESGVLAPVWTDHLYATPTPRVRTGAFELNTRWRLQQPLLTVSVGGERLDVIPQVGAPLFHGRSRMPVVVAGNGAPADYTGLDAAGAMAVVTRSDDVTPYDRAVAAADAGAALLMVVNDLPRELSEWVGGPNGEQAPVPVTSLSGTEGSALLSLASAGDLTALVTGRPNTRWLYDLQHPHPGRIPSDLSYQPTMAELARVSARYSSDRPAPAGEFRYDFRPYTFAGTGFLMTLDLPRVREEWVSAPAGTTWYQESLVLDSMWDQRSPRLDYDPGDRLRTNWFSPVVRPRLGDGYWGPTRSANFLSINLPAWGDGNPGNTGDLYSDPAAKQRIWLYDARGGLIRTVRDQAMWVEVTSPAKRRYQLVTVATRDADRWTTSTRTRTAWRFWSRESADVASLPLLSLDYGVATDLAGRVGRGPTRLRLTAVPLEGADLAGTVRGARLSASFDGGKTWRALSLTRRANGSWVTSVPHARSSDGTVALRATAWDSAGNRIKQTVVAAYRLR